MHCTVNICKCDACPCYSRSCRNHQLYEGARGAGEGENGTLWKGLGELMQQQKTSHDKTHFHAFTTLGKICELKLLRFFFYTFFLRMIP